MEPKQRTLVQIKHVWSAMHGRFQAVLTRRPTHPTQGPGRPKALKVTAQKAGS